MNAPVNPAIKYTLARLGLFFAVLLLLLPIPNVNMFFKLMIAILVSMVLSWFLLRGIREELATRVEQSMQRRAQQKEQLRRALAGDDQDSGDAADSDTDNAAGDDPQNRPDVR